VDQALRQVGQPIIIGIRVLMWPIWPIRGEKRALFIIRKQRRKRSRTRSDPFGAPVLRSEVRWAWIWSLRISRSLCLLTSGSFADKTAGWNTNG
jgi:hypothetical protein